MTRNIRTYNLTRHSEIGQPPQTSWEKEGFLPRLPETLRQLDLLLLTVATPRTVHPDGIHHQSLRYLDPVLADYTGEQVTARYDPRDLAEIRVFYRDQFLCRAICADLVVFRTSTESVGGRVSRCGPLHRTHPVTRDARHR
ncbi:Mu transposase C-terminal domain-containing protein [Streptomyces gardneri]|uniref:Mu transposase C-terminal domain-containing protein n=1 Tax=Nocardia TaxID=1817 RepID=UPI00135C4C83|nr:MULTISPECIES: Mu transposase C-terminal domain-containing protein [Nocardia]MBF6169750.1 Mu transposase C-terminal domain-containing protein [Streptomyces gardneri]